MSMNFNAIIRTVNLIKPYTVENKTGKNGSWTSEEALFTGATDRPYASTVVENGQSVKRRESDFFLFKVRGDLARVFHDNCELFDANGKLLSRRLFLQGYIETYSKANGASYNYVGYNGVVRTHQADTKDTKVIFVVTSIEFLDARPKVETPVQNVPQGIPQGYVMPQGYAMPQGIPQGYVMPQAPVQSVIPQTPVQPAMPQTPVQPVMPQVPIAPTQAQTVAPTQVVPPTDPVATMPTPNRNTAPELNPDMLSAMRTQIASNMNGSVPNVNAVPQVPATEDCPL